MMSGSCSRIIRILDAVSRLLSARLYIYVTVVLFRSVTIIGFAAAVADATIVAGYMFLC